MQTSRRQFLAASSRALCVGLPVLSLLAPCASKADDINRQAVDEAISRALVYISSQQKSEGFWLTDAWGESTAITSLAVMAFLSAGYVPGEGVYGEQINKGIRWVVSQQQANGMLIRKTQSHGPMYDHGICSLMLAEVCGMMDGADAVPVRRALEKAILLILESQAVEKFERHQGGWRYQIDSRDSDLSVTGWQVMALRAAKDIGCDVPADAIERAVEYVKMCSDRKQSGFGYQPGNSPTPTLTGTGITCLEVCGDHHSKESLAGAQWLLSHPLVERSAYFYYGVYYTGVGLFKIGGELGAKNYRHLVDILLPIQRPDGGWNPQHGSEKQAGRIYSTSLTVLAMAVDYRYLPIYQR
ncbi:prenyltransferase/squalene oxidase repeat-containing protein [Planctomicrobium piriforme]|uniref:Prenyltransferase and squalene oxidase repeat-containing protein n=1 Tax=Planctomicrobium piriforme TaxID=1576369 RepID=A0A1I3C196_9PLAN|nr:prenyltransferase/squalene oxidase repeat-containing protein [Planctomicrobium piriforme]SFH68314.1 Prenyltransferase and squalene oxidase repeat-containing protein [Planctomicrobium piriforme]